MKKLLLSLLLTSFTIMCFSHGSTDERSKCRWYAKKYRATARISIGVPICNQYATSCGQAEASCSKNCGYQYASRSANGSNIWGYINSRECSRGFDFSKISQKLLPSNEITNRDNKIEESKVNHDSAIFDYSTNSIKINNIVGFIRLKKGNGFYSSISLSVWRPSDDNVNFVEDTEMTESKILNKIEIKVTDSGIYFNGDLATNDVKNQFVVSEVDGEYIVKFENVSLNIPISKEISLDDLSVNLSSDAAPNDKENLENATSQTNLAIEKNEFKLDFFPNPIVNSFNVDFSNNIYDGQTVIELYDSNGQKLIDVFSGNLIRKEVKTISVNIEHLISGKYFMFIESNNRKLVKQIIKQ